MSRVVLSGCKAVRLFSSIFEELQTKLCQQLPDIHKTNPNNPGDP